MQTNASKKQKYKIFVLNHCTCFFLFLQFPQEGIVKEYWGTEVVGFTPTGPRLSRAGNTASGPHIDLHMFQSPNPGKFRSQLVRMHSN